MGVKDLVRPFVPRFIWERLRQARIRRHVRLFEPFVVEHKYGDVRLKVRIADGLSNGWYNHDWERLPEIDLLSRGKLKPGARVFDCGAHQAVVALMIRQKILPGGAIVAIEGMAHNCLAAQENIRLNNAETEVSVLHAVVSDAPGRMRFVDGLNGQVAHDGIGVWVDAMTIDQLSDQFGAPDVLFIDIEGYEWQALSGARRTLQSNPDCYVEVHVGCGFEQAGKSVTHVLQFFPPDRYHRWVWAADGGRPALFDPESDILKSRFCLVAISRQGLS
jgi:FkbM family methyltransferase